MREHLAGERRRRHVQAAFGVVRAPAEDVEPVRDVVERQVRDVGDACGLARRPSLYLSSGDADVEKIRRECEARRSIGVTSVDQSSSEKRMRYTATGSVPSGAVTERRRSSTA